MSRRRSYRGKAALNNDLDYENTEENSIIGQNTKPIKEQVTDGIKKAYSSEEVNGEETGTGADGIQVDAGEGILSQEEIDAQIAREIEAETPVQSAAVTNVPSLSFFEKDSLVWPIVGNILINYSMDKSVYFATLDQYKYNPAIIIAANEGDTICAAAPAVVKDIYTDAQTGNTLVMDIGNGYQLTYGQLENISVSVGEYIETGEVVAQIAAPTRYYTVEGCNAYFAMTKDGSAINPMTLLE